ncbi:hypothetical protein DXG03_006274 [Asterophora parasitica]|uniref:Uncharacterized protein n=1 Tax=Asterophora parasitica TaxID=117018 RepID=A0A9P7G591_9AGAR|nr:hypothetical protein DXG03_006274 [Asterophora parasitica]
MGGHKAATKKATTTKATSVKTRTAPVDTRTPAEKRHATILKKNQLAAAQQQYVEDSVTTQPSQHRKRSNPSSDTEPNTSSAKKARTTPAQGNPTASSRRPPAANIEESEEELTSEELLEEILKNPTPPPSRHSDSHKPRDITPIVSDNDRPVQEYDFHGLDEDFEQEDDTIEDLISLNPQALKETLMSEVCAHLYFSNHQLVNAGIFSVFSGV